MDKSQLPTGFLFEYSLAGADLSKFDGVNSDTLKNEGQILSLHEILNLSKVNSNAQIVPTDSLNKKASDIYSKSPPDSASALAQRPLAVGVITNRCSSSFSLAGSGAVITPTIGKWLPK